MRRLAILLLIILAGLAPLSHLCAQLTWSGDVAVLIKGLDRHLIENQNFRGDDPFHEIRVRLFPRHWVNDRIAFFGELLYDNGLNDAALRVNGAYVVINSLLEYQGVNLKAGLIPSPFGNYSLRSTYFNLNPLIGVPLMWHYRTPMPTDMYPTNEFLHKEKVKTNAAGYAPIGYDACWDTGVELFGDLGRLEYSLALTDGAMSSPGASANDGRQLMARLGLNLTAGSRLGFSVARGPHFWPLAADMDTLGYKRVEEFQATVIGVYAQYIINHLQFYGELVRSTWEAPQAYLAEGQAHADAGYLEGRYDFLVRWYLAARLDFIAYSLIYNPAASKDEPWGDDLLRLETGLGYRLSREAIVKLVYQKNDYRHGWRSADPQVLALQLHLAF
ncbi:MAG: hypothetical protein IID13_08055 [Candidatus Marinimicrobia bacterium]|nr:hypothetical protein [Candidatus Neomarinimicrobiota bacterium]